VSTIVFCATDVIPTVGTSSQSKVCVFVGVATVAASRRSFKTMAIKGNFVQMPRIGEGGAKHETHKGKVERTHHLWANHIMAIKSMQLGFDK
jgi:hypothetical protein